MTINVKIEGREQVKRELRAAGKRGIKGLLRGLKIEAEGVMRLSKREVDVDEGVLRASGFVKRPVRTRAGAAVTLGYGGAAQAYAVYLHEGTGPAVGRPKFFPPVAPFREWAKRVLGDETLGFVIARSVGQKGLKPRKYLEKPLKRRARGMGGRLAKHIRKEIGG